MRAFLTLAFLGLVSADSHAAKSPRVELGPRPFWLVEQMKESSLKDELSKFNGHAVSLSYLQLHSLRLSLLSDLCQLQTGLCSL